MGHFGPKTSSLGQILVYAPDYIFSLRLTKHSHNVCLNEISDDNENGSCQVINYM